MQQLSPVIEITPTLGLKYLELKINLIIVSILSIVCVYLSIQAF